MYTYATKLVDPVYVFLNSFIGVVAVAKAIVAEVSDDNTQACGIAVLSASWSLGLIIGSAIAGAIADPIGQYNLTISSEFIIIC